MKTKNRLLFVIPKLCNGGAERRVAFLANSFSQMGYDVSVLSFYESDGDYPLNEKIHRLHFSEAIRYNHHASDKKRLIELRPILRKAKANIVFTMHPPVAMMVGIAGFAIPFKAVDLVEVSPNHMQHMKRRIKGWKRSDAIILQCDKQKEYMPIKFQKKCYVCYNPVAQDFIDCNKKYNSSVVNFVNVGRLDPEKNHRLLLSSFKIAHDKYPNIKLTIYGRGPHQDDLFKLSHELGLDNVVSFIERSKNMKEDYLNSDAFILSSDFEGMPNALLEAMAVGLPSISTNCDTGPSDIIDNGNNGLLVPVNDVDALSLAITKFIEQPDYAIKLAKNGKETIINKFAENKIIDAYNQIIQGILK